MNDYASGWKSHETGARLVTIHFLGAACCAALAEIIKGNGINVVAEPRQIPVKSGLFGSKATDESVAAIKTWAKDIIEIVHQ